MQPLVPIVRVNGDIERPTTAGVKKLRATRRRIQPTAFQRKQMKVTINQARIFIHDVMSDILSVLSQKTKPSKSRRRIKSILTMLRPTRQFRYANHNQVVQNRSGPAIGFE
jgi:hypothetical protein